MMVQAGQRSTLASDVYEVGASTVQQKGGVAVQLGQVIQGKFAQHMPTRNISRFPFLMQHQAIESLPFFGCSCLSAGDLASYSARQRDPICTDCKSKRSSHADHVIPKRSGGKDELANLAGLCHSCHSSKTCRSDSGFGNPRAKKRATEATR